MTLTSKIAVTGPHGRLGSELVRQGCLPIEADVTDFNVLRSALTKVNPDVVIHCAAYTDVDGCENAPSLAALVNATSTYLLGQVFQGKIVYISTDYIFDGESGPYSETDKPNPISIYGWSKLGGEIALRNRYNKTDLIIRTTVLFDQYSNNFVTVIIGKFLRGEIVALPQGLYGSPTYIPYLAQGILAAIEKGLSGIINIAGIRVLSRRALAVGIGKLLALDEFQVASIDFNPGKAPRPQKAGLKVDKAISLGIPIYDPEEGLKEVVNALEKVAA